MLDDIVQASVSGAFSLGKAKMFFQEIMRRAREEKVDRILIDACGVTTEIPTTARFEFASPMAEQRLYAINIAFVSRKDTVWPDRFLESVSRNRGVNAKVVTEIEEAFKWLAE